MQIKCHEMVKHNVTHGQSGKWRYLLSNAHINMLAEIQKVKIKYKLQNSRKIQLTIKIFKF